MNNKPLVLGNRNSWKNTIDKLRKEKQERDRKHAEVIVDAKRIKSERGH